MIESPEFQAIERAYMASRRRYMPWTRTGEPDPAEAMYLEVLRRHAGADIDPDAYVSPDAKVFTSRFILGPRSWVASDAIVRGSVAIGADSTVNSFAHIAGRVSIGVGVRIASHASIFGFNHGFDRLKVPIYRQKQTSIGVVIGDGVWIGANAVVTDGCKIGAHSIVAAGAVVTKSFGEYLIVGGSPARVLRDRREKKVVEPAPVAEA